jgi:hypothetical protein
MKKYFDPNNLLKRDLQEENDYVQDTEFVAQKEDGLFHIGQSYEEKVADTLYCIHCQGNTFNVGQGSYYTAIKCTTCGWEVYILEG